MAGYRLASLVGEGATGAVYLAERASDERVALKLLDPELAEDERFRRRFLRESELAASLQHPHVVRILDFGETDGDLFLAMRYIPGSDLRELLARDGALDPARALDLLAGIADALDVAHGRGLVHRDVKPANILVDEDKAYLGDFGLAKHASSVSSLTGEQAFVGTIAYVSPEQIRGDELDGRADVYSLGCVLYECLAGAPPFDRESELAVVYAHLHERPPPLGGERPELPEGIDQVLRKATAKSPGERYESCAELIREARAAVAGERQPRPRIGALAAGVVGLAVVAAAVVLLTRGSDDHVAQARPLAVSGAGVSLVDAGSAWALLPGAQQVAQVDVARRKQVGKVALPFVPGGMAVAAGSL